jgi:hypothetical protein
VITNDGTEVQFALHNGPRRQPGSQIDSGPLPRVTQVLALALSFQDMIATGACHGDHQPRVIQDLSQHRPARLHPLFCGRRALSSGAERSGTPAIPIPSESAWHRE